MGVLMKTLLYPELRVEISGTVINMFRRTVKLGRLSYLISDKSNTIYLLKCTDNTPCPVILHI